MATRIKRKVSEMVEKSLSEMDGLFTRENMDIFPLGSYDPVIGMDWLEAYKIKLDCYNKNSECIDEEGNPRNLRGNPKIVYVRYILAFQSKKLFRKGFANRVAS